MSTLSIKLLLLLAFSGQSARFVLNECQLLDCTSLNDVQEGGLSLLLAAATGCSKQQSISRSIKLNSGGSNKLKVSSGLRNSESSIGLSNQAIAESEIADGNSSYGLAIQQRRSVEGDIANNEACSKQNNDSPQKGNLKPSVVCSPSSISGGKNLAEANALTLYKPRAPIEVYIRTPNNETRFDFGSALTIECRFNTSLKQDLRFKLRWLRSVIGSQGNNQSITSTNTGDSSMTIIAATKRVWTVQRNGGLDLELNDFQASDSGDYFCQAVEPESDSSILSSAKVHLSLLAPRSSTGSDESVGNDQNVLSNDRHHRMQSKSQQQPYSQENLSKLLPSLKVIPEFSEVALGESVQLICITNELDPDPEPNEIIWSFEPIDRSQSPMLAVQPVTIQSNQLVGDTPNELSPQQHQLPPNITILGNVLIVWSMSAAHCGLYKCTVDLAEFNLTSQSTGELALRPSTDSAPLVYVSPELIRLSPEGSATIQCEATGYPPPDIIWYRVDGHQQYQLGASPVASSAINSDDANSSATSPTIVTTTTEFNQIEGLDFQRIPNKDSMAYCAQNNCLALAGASSSSGANHHQRQHQQERVTGISLIHLSGARAQHQGQYVCRASNKHGSNQASSVVDVEFKEPPIVKIDQRYREQTIVLQDESQQQQADQLNVTFKCSIESGRPQPKLRWLRTTNSARSSSRLVNTNKNLEIYDLTKISSVTSNVSTFTEDNGRTLVLVIGTISLDDEGDYVCLGENEWGRHSALAHLYVRRPVSIKIPQSSPLLARVNDSFHLDCLASGYPLPLDIEWSRSDRGAFFSLISRTSNNGLRGSQERAMLKFDRVSIDESGEYTCNARDPLNSSIILRDTIMVVVEDLSRISNRDELDSNSALARAKAAQQQLLLPKLMVRPTKINAIIGSNVTLDCLTVSGLQPTIVEWIAPPHLFDAANKPSAQMNNYSFIVRPYHRAASTSGQLLMQQFGSKLKIFNLSKAHEGVYQCKGSNKVGTENAPALIKVLDSDNYSGVSDFYYNGHVDSVPSKSSSSQPPSSGGFQQSEINQTAGQAQTKTKVARVGLNIELKCQVNGVEQPATSWSREGLELPASSVQIEHNLWIQNVSQKDNGLYICSARSKQPNKVIQAKINLLVQGESDSASRFQNLSAKVVASKGQVTVGDSITLECIISQQQQQLDSSVNNQKPSAMKPIDLDEIERNVIWTNLHSGQSLFQDNVYIQNNLLIIYELRPENSATYRCNYNDLTQHTDYKLQVLSGDDAATLAVAPATSFQVGAVSPQQAVNNRQPPAHEQTGLFAANSNSFEMSMSDHQRQHQSGGIMNNNNNVTYLTASNGRRAELKQVPLGSRVKLECPFLMDLSSLLSKSETRPDRSPIRYCWTRGSGEATQLITTNSGSNQQTGALNFDSVSTRDADIYHCHLSALSGLGNLGVSVEPQSILLNVLVPVARFAQRPVSFITLPAISGADQQLEIELKFLPERDNGLILFSGQQEPNRSAPSGGDYISLGLSRGHLEFRFELGDGTTLLRSIQSLSLNQWHKVLIARNRRGAVMWVDKQPPVSNSSAGKFFNLNLDSVLYVGGHQHFLTLAPGNNKTMMNLQQQQLQQAQQQQQQQQQGASYSYNPPTNKTSPSTTSNGNHRFFYGYSRGFQGCISLLRISRQQINLMARNRSVALGVYECDKPECRQTEHCSGSAHNSVCQIDRPAMDLSTRLINSTRRASPSAEVRCICLPGFAGDRCERHVQSLVTASELATTSSGSNISKIAPATTTGPVVTTTTTSITTTTTTSSSSGGACELLNPCASNGTLKCQSLTSTSYKCHCKLGFMDTTCAQATQFPSETSVWFNQQAYLQFRFNKPDESLTYLRNRQQQQQLQQSDFSTTMTVLISESTTATGASSVGAEASNFNATHFGRLTQMAESQNISFKLQTKSSYGLIFYTGQAALLEPSAGTSVDSVAVAPPSQTSKSVVANLLSRLSNMVFDYLAIALVDGHVELSYELGSGVAIIRSSQRVNDGEEHRIRVVRQGKLAKLIIDELHKHEGSSPGKLSMLNSQADIYLGGLPHLAELTNNMYMSGFTGCLSQLEINSLGPLNLIQSNHLTQVRSARNLIPCLGATASTGASSTDGEGLMLLQPLASTTTTTKPHKLYQEPKPDSDDPDEM